MRPAVLPALRCPRCAAESTYEPPAPADPGAGEVREGTLRCAACGATVPIRDGVVRALPDPPGYVRREADGLTRFADLMERDGWTRERVLRLPDEPSPYWHGQRASFEDLLARGGFAPGERLLDVGANTCWASAAFARLGLDVVALDITSQLRQGLRTADWWMERDGTHFERVEGSMARMPLASGAFDHVFCCEVLHHNHLPQLFATLREAFRVLRPGGTLWVIREGLRAPGTPMLRPGAHVAEFEGNEHAYLAATYLLAARRAGFRVRVEDPVDHWVLSGRPFPADPDRSAAAKAKLALLGALRRRPRGRRAYRAWLHHVVGDVPFHFTAVKPG
jgi:ubiquinone/menaquinone biosynthesis C-methylase UbiE